MSVYVFFGLIIWLGLIPIVASLTEEEDPRVLAFRKRRAEEGRK